MCRYCENLGEDPDFDNEIFAMYYSVRPSGDPVLVTMFRRAGDDVGVALTDANYCLMCGRNLREEQKK